MLLLLSSMAEAQYGTIYYEEPEHTYYSPDFLPGEAMEICKLDFNDDGIWDHYFFFVFMDSCYDAYYYGRALGGGPNYQQIQNNGFVFFGSFPPPSSTVGDTISNVYVSTDEIYIWSTQTTAPEFEHEYMLFEIYNKYNSPEVKTYAWLEFSFKYLDKEHMVFTIHRYAYCSDPDYPFRVGQTSFDWDDVAENTSKSFSIYPNPSKDVVKISAVGSQPSVIKVYNCLGMLVEEFEMNSEEMEINVSDYNPGVYFFNVNEETVKIINN